MIALIFLSKKPVILSSLMRICYLLQERFDSEEDTVSIYNTIINYIAHCIREAR